MRSGESAKSLEKIAVLEKKLRETEDRLKAEEGKMSVLEKQYEEIEKEYMTLYHAQQQQKQQQQQEQEQEQQKKKGWVGDFSNSLCSYSGNCSSLRGLSLSILNFMTLKLRSLVRLSFSLSSSMVSKRSLRVMIPSRFSPLLFW